VYKLARPTLTPAVFLFVVDTRQEEDLLEALKDGIVMALRLLLRNALDGLATCGTMMQAHELGYTDCTKSYVFRGNKDCKATYYTETYGNLHTLMFNRLFLVSAC